MDKWSVLSSKWGGNQEACMSPLSLVTDGDACLRVRCQLAQGHEGPHEFVRVTACGSSEIVMEEAEVRIYWSRDHAPHPRVRTGHLAVSLKMNEPKEEGSGQV